MSSLFLLCALPPVGHAISETAAPGMWQAIVGSHSAMPPRLIAVDKDKQQLFVFSQKNQLSQDGTYVCTTGQRMGDKQNQGDLKTPEGIYFVVSHVNSGLDYAKYGKEAYTLNYPNPVDKLRGKTGYGIWIHGRGETISPLLTQGCVAMNNDDLGGLGQFLPAGTPVALSSSFAHTGKGLPEDEATARHLVDNVQKWAKAWADRSPALFSFYDADAYSKAQGESFSRFQTQKERLFKMLPWIKNRVHDVQALKGPGYWVTWFYQDYQAPNLSTEGVRRLYWRQNAKGQYVIVGMEWLPGLSTGSALADAEPASPPSQPELKSEEQAVPLAEATLEQAGPERDAAPQDAVQEGPAPLPVLASSTQQVGPAAPEGPLAKPLLALQLYDKGLLEPFVQAVPVAEQASLMAAMPASSPAASPALAPPAITGAGHTVAALSLPPALPSQRLGGASTVAPVLMATGPSNTVSDATHAAALPEKEFTAPAVEATTASSDSATPEGERLAIGMIPQKPEPESTAAQQDAPPAIEPDGKVATEEPQPVPEETAPQPTAQEAGTVRAERGERTTPAAQPVGEPAAQKAEAVSSDELLMISVFETVEEWRGAWEQADLDLYMQFYDDNAEQGGRTGAKAIRQQKDALWRKLRPGKILLQNVEISVTKDKAKAVMTQIYRDAKGTTDRGIKTLEFQLSKDMWFILREDWRAR
ncbi:L,D-transpeptidase family protein [Desulfovibrio cuneatus]|uniref:L,D-transpeptidase family protein n=1 Tax=Desulfovibrio cuneatus TaxID=159728 RepID=UPI00146FB2BC|nr:L,D-transpeptidase family protein [Desulfovibrio cuneatus]